MGNKITVIKSVEPERVCKTYALTGDTLNKTAVANITTGTGYTRKVETAQELIKILKAVTSEANFAIMPGEFNGDNAEPFKIISEGALANAANSAVGKVEGGIHTINGKRVAARLKRGITPSHWLLIDADDPEGIPDDWAEMNIQQRLELLEPIIPGLSKCERIELRGSSARVHKEGEEPGQATHAWIKVSDADKIEVMREYTRVTMVNQGLCFVTPKHSKETGKVVAGERRTVVDLAVWTAGRLVFCAKPDVAKAEGFICADANITIINEGAGALDLSGMALPDKTALSQMGQKTGVFYSYDQTGTSISAKSCGELTMETIIEAKGVSKSLKDWADEIGPDAKMRCEAPFRASASEAAFIKTYSDGPPTVHDVGVNTTYTTSAKRNIVHLLQEVTPGIVEPNEASLKFLDWKLSKTGVQLSPLSTRRNLEALIDWAGIDVRYDVYNRRVIAWHRGKEIKKGVDAKILDLAAKHELPKSTVAEQLDAIAYDRSINKPLQWLEARKKPEGDPLAEWIYDSKMNFEDIYPRDKIHKAWEYIIWRKFFIACCAAADQLERTPNKQAIDKFEQVVVIVSGQGMKKSTAIREMLPKELREYFGEGVNLNLGQKDSLLEATGYWIAELGELDATFRKSDIAALKAFLSKGRDEIRLPYDRRSQVHPRRTVYFASVNVREFLQDSTGNRRYLPIEIHTPLPYSEELGERIFAQAWHRYLEGEAWWLSEDEEIVARVKQEDHDGNPYIPALIESFDMDSPMRDFKLKPGIILEVLGLRGDAIGKARNSLKGALEHFGIKKAAGSYRESRYYKMPPASAEFLRKYRAIMGEENSPFTPVCSDD